MRRAHVRAQDTRDVPKGGHGACRSAHSSCTGYGRLTDNRASATGVFPNGLSRTICLLRGGDEGHEKRHRAFGARFSGHQHQDER